MLRPVSLILFLWLAIWIPSTALAQSQDAMKHAALGAAAEADEDWARALMEYSAASQADSSSNYLLGRVVHCVFELGRDDELMSLTRVLWKRDSTQDEAAGEAGEMALMNGRIDEAVEWFSAATRANPNSPDHWTHLGLAEERSSNLAEAEKDFERASSLDSEDRASLYQLGLLRTRANRSADALVPLRKLVELDPSYPHALVLLGQNAENAHLYDEAVQSFTQAASLEPAEGDRDEALRGIARVSLDRGQPDRAVSPVTGLIASHPDDLQLRHLYVNLMLRMRRPEDAITQLDTLSIRDPDNPSWISLQAQVLNRSGKANRARDVVRKFQQVHPAVYRGFEIGASLALEQNRSGDALKEIGHAEALAPESASVFYLKGQVLLAQDRGPEAEAAFLQATRLDSTYESAFFALGALRERANRLDESEVAFRRVLSLNPHNAVALNYLGYMFADRGLKLEEALNEINQALVEEPDNSSFLDSKGWALYRLGRLPEAREGLEEAIRKGGTDPLIHEHLGDVLVALKLLPEARVAYQEALRKDPHNQALARKLHDLEKNQP